MSDEGKDEGAASESSKPFSAVVDAEGDMEMADAPSAGDGKKDDIGAGADGRDDDEGAEVVEVDLSAEEEQSGEHDDVATAAASAEEEEEAPAAAAPAASADPPAATAPAEKPSGEGAHAEEEKDTDDLPEVRGGGGDGEVAESDAELAARARSDELRRTLALSDAESSYALLRSDRDALRSTASEQAAEVTQLRSEMADLRSEVEKKDAELAQGKRDVGREKGAREAAEDGGREAKERAERAGAEMDALREEISQLTASKSALNAELTELRTNASLSTSSAVPLRYELERTRTDLESVKSHSNWLESELDARTADLAKARANHSELSSVLRSDLDDANARADEASTTLEASRRAEERLRSELDRAGARLRDIRTEAADREAALEEELVAERRLVELSKEKSDRAEARHDALRGEVESMKKLAEAAAADSRDEMERLGREMEEKGKKALEELAAEKDRTIAELEQHVQEAERGRKKIEEDLMKTPNALKRRKRRSPLAITAGDDAMEGTTAEDGGPISLTDLYTRLSETEDELEAERTENKRLHLMLRRIQIDIEEKTPLMRQQAREAEAAIRAGDELRARTEEALAEAEAERARARAAELERAERDGECRALRRENGDLASQVQALLRSASDAPRENNGIGVGSGDVVDFGSVAELQSQNQRLLREHRRLQDQVSELGFKLETDPLRTRVEEADAELAKLREERERQVTMVKGIVQQRDLYRALLAKSDIKALASAEGGSDKVLAIEGNTEAKNRHLEDQVAKLQSDLLSATNAKTSLEERIARLDVHAADLSSSIDALRTDVSVAHAAKARSDADASYHRDRVARLEESLDNSRKEAARGAEGRKELQRVNGDLQKSLEVARVDGTKFEQRLRQVETKLRLAEAQAQTAQSAESRVAAEAASLRNELARQGALLDSVQRIEASLSAKTDEDRARLEEELKSKIEEFKGEGMRHVAEVEELKGRSADAELRAKVAEQEKTAAINNMVNAKEDAVRAKEDHRAISERCSTLEKALAEAKRQMGEAGLAEVDDEQIASAASQLEKAKAELKTAKERIEDLQNIAAANEKEVANLTKAQEEYQKVKDAEMKQLQDELATSRRTAQGKQEMLEDLGKELATHRGEQEKVVSDLKATVAGLETDRKNAIEDANAARAQVESLSEEIKSYQADATAANNNYERELAVHSAARTELRTARSQKEEELRLRQSAESQLKAAKAEFIGEKTAWEVAKSRFEKSIAEVENRLKEAREQNKVLHSQMATLTETVEKFQSERISSLAEANEDADGTTAAGGSTDEVVTLRKTVSELREVVQYMRSEREVLDAQVESAKRTAERERTAASAARRSLDNSRSELQSLQEANKGSIDKENEKSTEEKDADAQRLRRAEEQLTLLRESNSLLREEAGKTERLLEATRKELGELKMSSEPAEARCRDLVADKAALEAEKASLVREVDSWKSRVQSLVSKFNQIDPEEHTQALARADSLSRKCESLKILKEKADKECIATKALLVRLNKEITVHKLQLDSAKSSLAKSQAEKANFQKTASVASALTKERDQFKEAAKKADDAIKRTKADLAAATTRVENFQKMLRKMKLQIDELKKENQVATSKQKELQDALAKKEEASKQQEAADQKRANVSTAQTSGSAASSDRSATEAQKGKCEEKALASSAATKQVTLATTKQTTPAAPKVQELPKIPDGGFKFAPSSVAGSVLSTTAKGSAPSTIGVQQASTSATKASMLTNEKGKKEGAPVIQKTDGGSEPATKKIRIPSADASTSKIAKSPAKVVASSPTVGAPSKIGSPKLKPVSPKPSAIDKVPAQGAKEDALRERLLKRKRLLAAKLKQKEEAEAAKEAAGAPPAKRPALSKQEAPKQEPDTGKKPSKHQDDKGGFKMGTASKTGTAGKPIASTTVTEKTEPKTQAKTNAIGSQTPQGKGIFGASSGGQKASSGLSFGSGNGIGFAKASASPATSAFGSGSVFGKSSTGLVTGLAFGGASSLGNISEEGSVGILGGGLGFGGSAQLGDALSGGAASGIFGAKTTEGEGIVSTALGNKQAEGGKRSSATFLDLVPPGSGGSKPTLVFGKSSSITLPTPTGKIATPVAPSYGIFGQSSVGTGASPSSPFGAPVGFGGDLSKKRSLEADPASSAAPKIARFQEKNVQQETKKGNSASVDVEDGEVGE
mmetsp:Transcript_59757/g.177074  ORF Transcript_59757/g.177074 Transcript_59757/m.177074 type:complete len:2177 (-) Transcript_59757:51-6581(-)